MISINKTAVLSQSHAVTQERQPADAQARQSREQAAQTVKDAHSSGQATQEQAKVVSEGNKSQAAQQHEAQPRSDAVSRHAERTAEKRAEGRARLEQDKADRDAARKDSNTRHTDISV